MGSEPPWLDDQYPGGLETGPITLIPPAILAPGGALLRCCSQERSSGMVWLPIVAIKLLKNKGIKSRIRCVLIC